MGAIFSKSISGRSRILLAVIPLFVVLRLAWKQRQKQINITWRRERRAEAIARARNDRDASFEWARSVAADVNSEEFTSVSTLSFEGLQEALQSGEISAETALRVQITAALLQNDETNSIVRFIEINSYDMQMIDVLYFSESIDDARRLDELAKSPHYLKHPLLGIPLSVKEAVEVKNQRCSSGITERLDWIFTEDSYVVRRLRFAGMVIFCQTNVPTYCMTYNCVNDVYGQTAHPTDKRRTPGGSSGGEAATIATGGSRIGIGSDSGGSIRVPAAYAGCAGFKPSAARMTLMQPTEPLPCRPFHLPTEGPLAESPRAIVEIMRVLWSDDLLLSEDPFVVPFNFNENVFASSDKLRIGYFVSDGYIDPLPCMQRAVTEAAKKLESLGHTLVPFSMDPIAAEVYLAVAGTVFADGGAAVSAKLEEEALTPTQDAIRRFGLMPRWQKKLLAMKCRWRGEERFARLIEAMPCNAIDLQDAIDALYHCRKNLYRRMEEQDLHALLCPPTYSPAATHEFPPEPLLSVLWNGILNTLWNALDVPAGVIPFGRVTNEDEEELMNCKPKGMLEKALKEDCLECVGLPLAVQFVAAPFRDEIVLRLMFELSDATNFTK